MRIYLDDDSVSSLLRQLLEKAGHDVQIPAQIGIAGEDDAVHLTQAVTDQRIVLTHNHKDFENLHKLVMAVGGHHPGIMTVRRDNNLKRDMSDHAIVRAVRKLLAAGIPLQDQVHVLNHWR